MVWVRQTVSGALVIPKIDVGRRSVSRDYCERNDARSPAGLEVLTRTDATTWTLRDFREGVASVEAIGCDLSLDAVYEHRVPGQSESEHYRAATDYARPGALTNSPRRDQPRVEKIHARCRFL